MGMYVCGDCIFEHVLETGHLRTTMSACEICMHQGRRNDTFLTWVPYFTRFNLPLEEQLLSWREVLAHDGHEIAAGWEGKAAAWRRVAQNCRERGGRHELESAEEWEKSASAMDDMARRAHAAVRETDSVAKGGRGA